MMNEVAKVKEIVNPSETSVFVVDSMTGQDAVIQQKSSMKRVGIFDGK